MTIAIVACHPGIGPSQVKVASWLDEPKPASWNKLGLPIPAAPKIQGQFNLLEVDSSYYAMPNPANSQLWAEGTPRDFTFNIKAFRLFTGLPQGRRSLLRMQATLDGRVFRERMR